MGEEQRPRGFGYKKYGDPVPDAFSQKPPHKKDKLNLGHWEPRHCGTPFRDV